MKHIIEIVQNPKFWTLAFRTALILLLLGIFVSLNSISQSIRREPVKNRQEKALDVRNEKNGKVETKKQEEKKVEEKKENVPSTGSKDTAQKEEKKDGFWSLWANDADEKKTASGKTSTTSEVVPEQKYTFVCDGGKNLTVYEGKYDIRGQKGTLEAGKIALDEAQIEKTHFLTKSSEVKGKAVYEKVVTRLENTKEATYTYAFATFSNGTATFTKNGKNIYTNCKISK